MNAASGCIRPAGREELESLLTLNQAHTPHVGSIDLARMRHLHTQAAWFLVLAIEGQTAGFLVTMTAEADYDSPNFIWFSARYEAFAYVDRIVVLPGHRRLGLASRLYREVEARAALRGIPRLTCEYNLRPSNQVSAGFHRRYGFHEVGRQETDGGHKRVSLQAKPVDAGLLGQADEFARSFGVWDEARPYLDRMVTPEDLTRHEPGGFSSRLDHFVMFGPWDDIPEANRRRIDARYRAVYVDQHRDRVERLMRGEAPEGPYPNDAVLLLPEVEEMIDAAAAIAVNPCNCRRLGQKCERPVETCIYLDDVARASLDRGEGRALTREEAKELLRLCDRKGLMHTANANWREDGLFAICNCCACDCYPFHAGQALGARGGWPRARYLAVHDTSSCNSCGACVRRCQFDAFFKTGETVTVDGKERKRVTLDPEACWGCGLCANTCPEDAIRMAPITPNSP